MFAFGAFPHSVWIPQFFFFFEQALLGRLDINAIKVLYIHCVYQNNCTHMLIQTTPEAQSKSVAHARSKEQTRRERDDSNVYRRILTILQSPTVTKRPPPAAVVRSRDSVRMSVSNLLNSTHSHSMVISYPNCHQPERCFAKSSNTNTNNGRHVLLSERVESLLLFLWLCCCCCCCC